jgi:hypothetical protein
MYITKTKISYPLTLSNDIAFVKKTLAIETNIEEDDEFINALIEPATEATEGQINQDVAYTSNTTIVKKFSGTSLNISQGNFNSMTSVVNNDSSTLITSYTTEKSYDHFIITFPSEISCDSLTIKFTTGYEKLSDVPKALKFAILVKTCDLFYHQRGSYVDNFSKYESTWENLCQQYKLL